MQNAMLLRAIDRTSVVVLMRDTLAVVQAELESPFTQQQFTSVQGVHALKPMHAEVELGPYDMDRTRFTSCRINLDFTYTPAVQFVKPHQPPQQTQRMDYSARRRRQ